MRIRRIAVLIDGGFFIKRLPKVVDKQYRDSAEAVAETARVLCKRHVQRLIGEQPTEQHSRWLDHVYRLFYYDASPYEGTSQHPLTNQRIDFGRTSEAEFRRALFSALRRKRKFALRLGKVVKESDWRISPRLTKPLLKTRTSWVPALEQTIRQQVDPLPDVTADQVVAIERLIATLRGLNERDVTLGLRQKGVDMRIGLDIASITLKKQADTIVLVTGDSDFVPAAKLARREGVEFVLDPMRQSISDDLSEHVDGIASPLRRPDADAEDDGDDPHARRAGRLGPGSEQTPRR